jgi:hypothetical protein
MSPPQNMHVLFSFSASRLEEFLLNLFYNEFVKLKTELSSFAITSTAIYGKLGSNPRAKWDWKTSRPGLYPNERMTASSSRQWPQASP